MARLWRIGRHLGRTLYEMQGDYPSDDDQVIGMLDAVSDARSVVRDHNRVVRELRRVEAARGAPEGAGGQEELTRYAWSPGHSLADVRQSVLNVARAPVWDAAEIHDVDKEQVESIADAVVAQLAEHGYLRHTAMLGETHEGEGGALHQGALKDCEDAICEIGWEEVARGRLTFACGCPRRCASFGRCGARAGAPNGERSQSGGSPEPPFVGSRWFDTEDPDKVITVQADPVVDGFVKVGPHMWLHVDAFGTRYKQLAEESMSTPEENAQHLKDPDPTTGMFNWVLIFGIDRFAIGVPAPREALWTIESVDGGLQVRHTQTNAVLPEPRDWTVDDLAESLFTTLRITEQNEMVIAVDSALAPRLDAALRARVGKRGFGA